MKIRRNYGIRSELCRECKRFMDDDCPVRKYNSMWIKDESVLQGVTTFFAKGETFIVECEFFDKQNFLSDYFKFLR